MLDKLCRMAESQKSMKKNCPDGCFLYRNILIKKPATGILKNILCHDVHKDTV